VIGYIRAGKLRALAVTSATRLEVLRKIGHVVCAVRDVHQINTGHHLEQLARGMRRAADTT
jgi:hypothetical protein